MANEKAVRLLRAYASDDRSTFRMDFAWARMKMSGLMSLLDLKNEIAKAVEEELEKAMSAYGFEIVQTLIVDTEPDEYVKRAMSEINAESDYQAGLVVELRDSVLAFSMNVPGTTSKDFLDMVLVTQYFVTMKEIGALSESNPVFITHGPGTPEKKTLV